jgi:outer membrane murein-binding lipoprotein Lpp
MKPIITIGLVALAVAMLSGCSSTQLVGANSTLQAFNAAAAPRVEQDIQTAIGGASGAVAAQLAASLQGNGTIDPSVLGSAAGVGALTALVKLDINRAQGTAERKRLNTWLVAIQKHRATPRQYLAYRKLHGPPLRTLYVGNDEVHPLAITP